MLCALGRDTEECSILLLIVPHLHLTLLQSAFFCCCLSSDAESARLCYRRRHFQPDLGFDILSKANFLCVKCKCSSPPFLSLSVYVCMCIYVCMYVLWVCVHVYACRCRTDVRVSVLLDYSLSYLLMLSLGLTLSTAND